MQKLKLASGAEMPSVGLGLWKIDGADAPAAVRDALAAGYRHLDSASDYGNEAEVGVGIESALQSGVCKREDLWVTSKLWNTNHRREHVRPALKKTLADLRLDYLDLYLIHFPIALEYVPPEHRYPADWIYDPSADTPALKPIEVPVAETWAAMEKLVRDGLVRHIGVCNFNTSLLRDLVSYAEIRPEMLQIESHPYLTQEKLIRMCAELGIAVTAFSPLGALSYVALDMARQDESVLTQPAVLAAATRTGKTPAQVVLRWGLQRGTAVIPKTTRPERLRENLDLFDFSLEAAEMSAISALNSNRRYNDPGVFCELAFGTFYPIYD